MHFHSVVLNNRQKYFIPVVTPQSGLQTLLHGGPRVVRDTINTQIQSEALIMRPTINFSHYYAYAIVISHSCVTFISHIS